MRKFLGVFTLITLISIAAYAAVTHYADGIKIGPDSTGDERLPIFDFDEWCPETNVGEMTALETRVLTLTDMPTLRPGQTLVVRPLNPLGHNQTTLLISHAYVPVAGTVKVVIKNLENSTVDYESDQWCIGGWNTVNPN